MQTYFQNLENALKRAREFCDLGKNEEALDCLYDALKSKKQRIIKQVHENIINKFLELCVSLKRGQTAKDGLFSYRNICQSIDLKSWEDAVNKYIQLAESKVDSAQELSQDVTLDVDDLDQDITPEILLKSVSNEGSQDRKERVILLPWIKHLWNCYRNCLDLLKNARSDRLYHTVAQHALKFCVKFSRRNELRKINNIIKIQTAHMQKRQLYSREEDSETQLFTLETGFTALESAISMELWQDAFKAIEDIHSIIAASKKFQHSRIMSHYYEKLSCVLWKGGEYLFHAAAVLRLFLLHRDQKKNLTVIDMTKLASRVILSAIAVPFPSSNSAINMIAETDVSIIDKKHRLLTYLLDLTQCPTRSGLIKEIIRVNINQCVPKEISDLFQTIEFQVEPLKLNLHVSCLTKFVKDWTNCNLEQYIPLIHEVSVVRLLAYMSKIYQNVKISKLLDLIAIPDLSHLERVLVDSTRKYEFPLTIDHKNQCIHFSSDINIFQDQKSLDEVEFHKADLKCLAYIHSSLAIVVNKICPERENNKKAIITAKIVDCYHKDWDSYRKKLLQRKSIIEKYKEDLEHLRHQKAEEQKRIAAAKILQYEAAEKERLIRETEERNLQRLRREQDEIKRKILLEKMETFKKSGVGYDTIENLDILDLDNTDPQILFCKKIEQINKERRELSSRLRRQERNFDHLERAKRVEELPLLIDQYEKDKRSDIEWWDKNEKERIETAYKNRAQDLLKKRRMLEIKPDLETFIFLVKRNHLDNYEQKMSKFREVLENEKSKRLKERAESRKLKRRNEWVILHELQQKLRENLRLQKKNSSVKKLGTKKERRISIQTENTKDFDTCLPFPESTTVTEEMTISRDTFQNKVTETACSEKLAEVITSDRHNPTDVTRYFERKYELRSEQILRNEAFEQKTTYLSTFSTLYTTAGNKNSASNINTSRRMRTNILDRNEETLYYRSPRIPSDSGMSSINREWHVRSENPVPQKPITIMKRSTRSDIRTAVEDLDPVSEVLPDSNTGGRQSDTSHSCTPWAKLKRLEQKK